jgi:hypothetical protein
MTLLESINQGGLVNLFNPPNRRHYEQSLSSLLFLVWGGVYIGLMLFFDNRWKIFQRNQRG